MNLYGTNGSACVHNMNTAAQSFNKKLISLVDYLNKELTDAKFIYLNTYGMVSGDPKVDGRITRTLFCFSSKITSLIYEQIYSNFVYYGIDVFQVSRL